MTTSLTQTNTLIPTINCGENKPDVTIPAFPSFDEPATLAESQAQTNAAIDWAVQAIGSFREEKVLRSSTRTCLNDFRQRGIIN